MACTKKSNSKSKAVQSTNDSSIVSKLSMTEAGYFKDPFLKYFVSKPAKRTALINRGYYIRATTISHVLTSFLDTQAALGNELVQIISLGAGFDTSYFRLVDQRKKCKYIEVDFPPVIDSKLSMISASPLLSSMVNGKMTPTNGDPCYHAVGCDLRDLSALHQALTESCDVDFCLPTLLLSECVLTYVETAKVNSLLKWCSKSFTDAVFCTYEQIQPNDGFGLIMQQHFSSLGSSLKNINSFPTLKSQEDRYKHAGWDVCVTCDMNDFFSSLPLSERRRVSGLQLFDEFEEWHLKCGHYMLLCAASGSCVESITALLPSIPPVDGTAATDRPSCNSLGMSKLHLIKDNSFPARYAHTSVQLSTEEIVMVCGFGRSPLNGVHTRLSDVVMMKQSASEDGVEQWNCTMMDVVGNRPGAIMHHQAIPLSDDRVLIYGGRTSPTKANGSFHVLKLPGNNKAEFEEVVLSPNSAQLEPRWRHSLNTLTVEGTECVAIIGGQSTRNVALNDCCWLNTTTWTLETLPICLPEGRHSHCALTYAGCVLVIGGLDSDLQPLSSCLQIATGPRWSITNLKFTPPLPERYSMSGCVKGDEAWLVGGVSLKPTQEILRLDLVGKTWMKYNIDIPIDVGPVLLHNHTIHLVNDGGSKRLIVLGGGGNCFSFGTYMNSCPLFVRLPMS